MNQDIGKLILRLTLGVLILFHGANKLVNGIGWLDGMLAAHGLPAFIKYGVYVGEVVAPLLLITGFYSRIGAWLIAVNMLFALWLVHLTQLAQINPQTGGLLIEAQYMYVLTAIALALVGPGRHAVNDR